MLTGEIVFYTMLKPCQINRFDVRIEMIDAKPLPKVTDKGYIHIQTKELLVHISKLTEQ